MVFVVALVHVCDSPGLPEPHRCGSGQQLDCEWQILEQIPSVQPPWLTDEPERPFQTRRLHPLRGSWQRIRRERDRRATTNEPGGRERRGQARDEAFLLGESEPYVYDVGRRRRETGVHCGDGLG